MKNEHIKKIMNVWESNNKILNPGIKKNILAVVEQIASLFSAGNYYYYVLNFDTYQMEFASEGTQKVLGIDSNEFSLEKFLELLHPEDLEKLHEKESASINFKLTKIATEDITKYKTVYLLRVKLNNGIYKTILHQSQALSISNDGKVFQVMGIHTDITHLNIPIDHKISFISNELPSYYSLNTGATFDLVENNFSLNFTIKEKLILNEIATGKTFNEIAQTLYISPHTVNTHKKNILKKSNCKNTAELITKCIREGVI
jgi:DNA-binding CsgD family transcriptional regulator